MSPSNPKSKAKKARHGYGEHSNVKPVKKQVQSVPDKARGVSFEIGEREVGTSADARVDLSVSTKVVGLTSTREREKKKTSFPSSFKIIVGSYERLLYGLEGTTSVSTTGTSELEWTLKPIFIFPAHVSCIKTVAASPQGGKWLATGSGDEIIKVWDLRRRKEVGGLMQHEGIFFFLHPILLACASEPDEDFKARSLILPSHHARTSSLHQKMERCAYFVRVTGPCFGL
jgi:WD40 repeat protein